MRRTLLTISLAGILTVALGAPALARPPADPPPPWDSFILCVGGYHALSHPVHSWGTGPVCIPDPHSP